MRIIDITGGASTTVSGLLTAADGDATGVTVLAALSDYNHPPNTWYPASVTHPTAGTIEASLVIDGRFTPGRRWVWLWPSDGAPVLCAEESLVLT